MPELPEVESVRRQLEPVLVGKKIISLEVLREKSFSGDLESVIGSQIIAVKRKAKVIFVELRNRKKEINYLMIHLKMTGQLIYEDTRNKEQETSDKSINNSLTHSPDKQSTQPRIVGGHPNKSWTNKLPDSHTRVIIKLNKGTLFFNDQRVFGWVKVVDQLLVNQIISKLPPDIIDRECDEKYFYKILKSSGRAVKLVILDSQKVGGIGNIYACDGLYLAGINPQTSAKTLTKKESDILLKSLKQVVNLGIKMGGATAADGKFVNTMGQGGKYQDHFLVYEQTGQVRERNGIKGIVQKFKQGGRGTYWVPEHQK